MSRVPPAAFASSLCGAPPSWIIGFSQADVGHSALQFPQRIQDWRDSTLWRFDPAEPKAARFCRSLGQ
ncbi:MAG: hypothetical protein ACKO8O_11070 [Betaproteobacteria bacterium]